VIVCAHNEARLLPACLHSLLAQTRPADDILVINNASTRVEIGTCYLWDHRKRLAELGAA
jgi:GT2 family glycosyltransferase